MALRFGINLNTRCPILYPSSYSASDMIKLATMAEENEYRSVWVGDNYFSKPRLESITTLAAVASRTTRVKLGTAALISPLRDTLWLALAWSTLDIISSGRTILAVCVGGGSAEAGGPEFMKEFEMAKVPYGRRGRILSEQIEILRKLWSEQTVTYVSKDHKIDRISFDPKPSQKPTVPLWISSNPHIFTVKPSTKEAMLRRVAALGDGWMTVVASPDEFQTQWRTIIEFVRSYGRSESQIEPAYQMSVNINEDERKAHDEARDYLNRYYSTNYERLDRTFWKTDPFGRPAEVVKKIEGLATAGVKTMILRFASPDQFTQFEKFTREILPSF